MKQFGIIILALLLLVPPVQAHADAIIFDTISEVHVDDLDDDHIRDHHQNDTEEERNTEHHHHCTMIGFSSAIILPNFKYNFSRILKIKKEIIYFQTLNTSNFLDELFQPPRI